MATVLSKGVIVPDPGGDRLGGLFSNKLGQVK